MLTEPMLDWVRLRRLTSDEQDTELRKAVATYKDLLPELVKARKMWRFWPGVVLTKFRSVFPEVTETDIQLLMDCYDRVYGR